MVGVHLTTTHFLPLVRKGQAKKIVNVSTVMSSIAGNLSALNGGGFFPDRFISYRVSKAALNMGEHPGLMNEAINTYMYKRIHPMIQP